jgi:hypothetical protein
MTIDDRRRYVKCDESKPACKKCLKFGVECDGYESKPKRRDRTFRGGLALTLEAFTGGSSVSGRERIPILLPFPG